MAPRDPNRYRRLLAWASVVMAVVFFVALNIWANRSLTNARLDLTADRLYTLSAATREVLEAVREPVRLRLFMSETIDLLGPVFAVHARRVDELLSEYERLAEGKVIVDRIDPRPFSPEEDQALSEGLRGIALREGDQIYFGLIGNNSTDDREVIRLLSPERASFLEYDLTKLIYSLDHPEKPVLGVIGALPIRGTAANGYRPLQVLEQLEEVFTINRMREAVERIDDRVQVLMLTQPQDLDPRTLYAIDQFALRGGRIMAFLDPVPEMLRDPNPEAGPAPATAIAEMAPLLEAWGVSLSPDQVAGDRSGAARVQIPRAGPGRAHRLCHLDRRQGRLLRP